MTAITTDSTPKARTDIARVELDGEIVLYDDSTRRLHRLNPTASILWICLDGSATLRQIAFEMAEVFEADVYAVMSDVVALAGQLAEEGLIRLPDREAYLTDPNPPGSD